jgi:acyl-CoA reductase-like NAD-dependent aldehyde dehydrogenase
MFKKSRTYGVFVHGQYVHSPHSFQLRKPDPSHALQECAISYLKKDCPESRDILEAALQGIHETFIQQRDRDVFPLSERLAFLKRLSRKLDEQQENLAQLLCGEIAKPIDLARLEITRARATIEATIQEAPKFLEVVGAPEHLSGNVELNYRRVPRGPLLAITPFNFPINLALHKLAPAWALGIPVILKASPKAALSSLCLADFVQSESLPPGFLSVLQMDNELVDTCLEDPRISQVSFTGSKNVGWKLAKKTAKPFALELGGAAPMFVDKTADLSKVIEKAIPSAFAYSGQSCISLQNLFVHDEIYQKLRKEICLVVKDLGYGGLGASSLVGSVIDEEAYLRCRKLRGDLLEHRATILCESSQKESLSEPNWAIPPTVFENVPLNSSYLTEEAFAPFLALHPVVDFDEFLSIAKNLPCRLQTAVFTSDLRLAHRAISDLPYGGVLINESPSKRWDFMPYGGMGESGVFREGPRFTMEFLSETKMSALII